MDEIIKVAEELESVKMIDKTNAKPLAHCMGPNIDCKNKARWRRQNAMYENEEDNWVFVCDECYKEIEEYWDERWKEYYSGCM